MSPYSPMARLSIVLILLMGVSAPATLRGQLPPQGCQYASHLGVVTGTVVDDKSNLPKAGARVAVFETPCWTLADRAGEFTLVGIPIGNHRLVAKYQSYLYGIASMEVAGSDTVVMHFRLSSDPEYVRLGGCDADDVESGVHQIPRELSTYDLAVRYSGPPSHGWGCIRKSLRRRIANDSTIVDLYAAWLSEEGSGPETAHSGSLLYFLALNEDPAHISLFLEYARNGDEYGGSYWAIEGLVRLAQENFRALEGLVSLYRLAPHRNGAFNVLQGLVRVNTRESRQYLRELLETEILNEWQQGMVARALERGPCPPGTFLDLRRFHFAGCLSHDP